MTATAGPTATHDEPARRVPVLADVDVLVVPDCDTVTRSVSCCTTTIGRGLGAGVAACRETGAGDAMVETVTGVAVAGETAATVTDNSAIVATTPAVCHRPGDARRIAGSRIASMRPSNSFFRAIGSAITGAP